MAVLGMLRFGLVLVVAVYADLAPMADWGYAPSHGCDGGKNGRCGPNEWYTMQQCASCEQQGTQSPVDLKPSEASDDVLSNSGFKLEEPESGHVCDRANIMLNAHTVEVSFTEACADMYSLTFQGKKYKLNQHHFHSPSENTWDGGHFALEAHWVHLHTAENGEKEYVVLAAMVGISDDTDPDRLVTASDSPLLKDSKLADFVKNGNGSKKAFSKVEKLTTSAYDLLPKSVHQKQYYFEGSMTTPPCNPAPVHWLMATEPVFIRQGTLDSYRALINSVPDNQLSPFGVINSLGEAAVPKFSPLAGAVQFDAKLGANARPVQPMTGPSGSGPDRQLYLATVSGSNHPSYWHMAIWTILAIVCLFCCCQVRQTLMTVQCSESAAYNVMVEIG